MPSKNESSPYFLSFAMRIQLWSKLFKRKPITAVILGLVLISALLTVYRLASSTSSSSSRDPHDDAQNSASYSKTGRSTSPVDLSWPLPFPQEKESSKKHSISTTTRRKITVDDNQLKKLKKIYPMYVSFVTNTNFILIFKIWLFEISGWILIVIVLLALMN